MQKRIEKTSSLNIDCLSILRRFWLHFGRSWRGFGEHLAVQKKALKGTIKIFDKIPIFKGFGQGLGRVWEGFGEDFPIISGDFFEKH